MAWEPDYITVDELADYIRIDDDLDEVQLALAVTSASRAVDHHCKRQFGRTAVAEARYYTPRWSRSRGVWRVPVDDFMDDADLVVELDTAGDGTWATTIAAVTPIPVNSAAKGRPWEMLVIPPSAAAQPVGREFEVRATTRWGWLDYPPSVPLATKLQASRFHTRRDAPFGVAGSPSSGSEMRLLAKLDPDLVVGLAGLRREVMIR